MAHGFGDIDGMATDHLLAEVVRRRRELLAGRCWYCNAPIGRNTCRLANGINEEARLLRMRGLGEDLTFGELRAGNVARIPKFRNAKGELSHNADGSDWTLSDWSNAVAGEVGEAANVVKKIRRGDFTLAEGRDALADELADVATYLDILAFRAGISLGEAVIAKFNRVSDKVGAGVYLKR